MKNQLNGLKVKCKFKNSGCRFASTIGTIDRHENTCQYNEVNNRVTQRVDNPWMDDCITERVKKKRKYDYEVMKSALPKNLEKKSVELAKEALYLCVF